MNKKTKKETGTFMDLGTIHNDDNNVLGVGKCKLQGEWIRTKVSINLLQRALKVLQILDYENKDASVSLVWTKDYPLILGTVNEKKMEVTGVILAPRKEE